MVFLANTKAIGGCRIKSCVVMWFVFFEQFSESVLRPFVNLVTFEISVAARLKMEFRCFLDFFILDNAKQINQRPNTRQINHEIAFGKGYVACTGL
jgi:hypothetical protein